MTTSRTPPFDKISCRDDPSADDRLPSQAAAHRTRRRRGVAGRALDGRRHHAHAAGAPRWRNLGPALDLGALSDRVSLADILYRAAAVRPWDISRFSVAPGRDGIRGAWDRLAAGAA